MTPIAFCPRLAFAVPTVKVGRGSARLGEERSAAQSRVMAAAQAGRAN